MLMSDLLAVVAAAAFIVIVIAAYFGGQKQAAGRIAFVKSYRFPKDVQESLVKRIPEMAGPRSVAAWEALRQYFMMHAHRPGRFLGMPSVEADEAWHEFLMHAEYQKFCGKAFGRELVHVSDPDAVPKNMSGAVPKRDVLAAWDAWSDLAKNNPGLRLAPVSLLFTADAKAGAGWIYGKDALGAMPFHERKKKAGKDGGGCGGSCGSSSSGGSESGSCGGGDSSCGDGGSCGGSCGGGD